jgi:hypothetical protein
LVSYSHLPDLLFGVRELNGFELSQIFRVVLPYAKEGLALLVLCLLVKQGALSRYKSLLALLLLIFLTNGFGLLFSHLRPTHLLYGFYFYSFWLGSMIQAILMLAFCYELLMRVFSSLPELQSISTRVFRWVVVLGCVSSAVLGFSPSFSGTRLFVEEIIQLSLLQGLICFCTALVVFAYLRTLGLPLRSRISGFALGILFSAMSVFPTHLPGELQMEHYVWIAIFVCAAVCAQLISWVAAMLWPEPVRVIVAV